MGKTGDGQEFPRMDGDATGNGVMGGGEERGAPRQPPQDSRYCEADDCHPHEDTNKAACR